MKILLVGASIPNLYAARILKEQGHNPIIIELHKELTNDQQRLIPSETLTKLNLNLKEGYYILKNIKHLLAKDLDIKFNTNNKEDYDIIILNTKFKDIESNKNVFTINYNQRHQKPLRRKLTSKRIKKNGRDN